MSCFAVTANGSLQVSWEKGGRRAGVVPEPLSPPAAFTHFLAPTRGDEMPVGWLGAMGDVMSDRSGALGYLGDASRAAMGETVLEWIDDVRTSNTISRPRLASFGRGGLPRFQQLAASLALSDRYLSLVGAISAARRPLSAALISSWRRSRLTWRSHQPRRLSRCRRVHARMHDLGAHPYTNLATSIYLTSPSTSVPALLCASPSF